MLRLRLHWLDRARLRQVVTPATARALALLGTIAVSLALFAYEVFGGQLVELVKTNALAFPVRVKLIAGMAAAFVLAVIGGGIYAWRADATRLGRVARLLSPMAILGLIPPLCVSEAWPHPVYAAIAIGGVVLLTERLVSTSFEAAAEGSPPSLPWNLGGRLSRLIPTVARRWGPLVVVVASALGYALYMSVYTLRMHDRFGTWGYDLGQYDNVFWSTLHGHPMRDAPLNLIEDWSELRDHADLSVFVLLPFYAIKPGAPALLVIQSCVLGLGAIPLYRFAARHLTRSMACVVVLAYLLYPPMHGSQFYDFHFQPIASTFILLVIDFIDEKRYVLCALAFVVALGCREDVAIGLTILGAFLAMSGYRPRAGIAMAATAGAYFVVMRFLIMPRLGPTNFGVWTASGIYKDLTPEGAKDIGGVLMTLVTDPAYVFSTLMSEDKLLYALQILVPLALLPLRRRYFAVSLIHGSILTVLTTGYRPTIDIGFQYSADFIPYIFPAAAIVLKSFGDTPPGVAHRRAALAAVVTGTVLCGVFWGAIPPRKIFKAGFEASPMTAPTEADLAKHKDLVELHAMVPTDAWLAMSEHEMPHVSRLNMLSLKDTSDADYLLYATGSGYLGSTNGDKALWSGQFEKVAERPGLVLLKRKRPPAPSGQ
jgi:uncharacterized membrane protein